VLRLVEKVEDRSFNIDDWSYNWKISLALRMTSECMTSLLYCMTGCKQLRLVVH